MLLRDWLAAWRGQAHRSAIQGTCKVRRHKVPSSVETLEVRIYPSAYSFTAVAWESSPMFNRDLGTGANPTLRDLDADGDLDNLSGNAFGQFFYYRNNGTNTTPTFPPQSQVTTGASINPMRNQDVGDGSYLAWGDLDGDSDLDLLVGNQQGGFSYYRNTGSTTAPAFTVQSGSNNPMNGVDIGLNSTPTLGDLDGDGDLDLIVGEREGSFRYFRNTGSSSSPTFAEQTGADNPLNGVSLGAVSLPTPVLVNLDGDADLDLVIGRDTATLVYYKNTGTASAPVFTEQTGSANPWNGITFVSNPSLGSSGSAPAFGDLDGDGDPDLLVGLSNGACAYYLAAPIPSTADLELSQSIDAPSPGPGSMVTFTVTITNHGPVSAGNITVANPDPQGLNGLSFVPSIGTYSAGVWTIPTLTASGTATLTISGTVQAAGSDISNTAEVTASDKNDPDSTPNNQVASEDDQTTTSLHVNANPTLTASLVPTLDGISVNIPNELNSGTLISDIISRLGSGAISDPDPGALQGIAINGISGISSGSWEYTINGGTTWTTFATANNDTARLLASNSETRIRYVPNAGYKGQAAISFVAWDQSSGTNGGTGVTKFRTGSSPFSSGYATATLQITNSAPVLDNSGSPSLTSISINHPSIDNAGSLVSSILASMSPSGGISDSDSGAVQGIAINGLGNTSTGAWEYTVNGGTNWSPLDVSGNTSAKLLAADANTRVRYLPDPGFKGQVKFAFVAWDRTSGSNGGTANVSTRGGTTPFSSAFEYATLEVTNAAPVLTTSGTASLDAISNTLPEGMNTGLLVSDLISRMEPSGGISDSDSGATQGIAIVGLLGESTGSWQYSSNGGTTWSAIAATGTINARLLAANSATRIRYVPNHGFVGAVKFAFVAWDQTSGIAGNLERVSQPVF